MAPHDGGAHALRVKPENFCHTLDSDICFFERDHGHEDARRAHKDANAALDCVVGTDHAKHKLDRVDDPGTREEKGKNVRIAIRALAVAALFMGGLANCASVDSNGHVTITGGVIDRQAFSECSTILSVTITDSVTKIGKVRYSLSPPRSTRQGKRLADPRCFARSKPFITPRSPRSPFPTRSSPSLMYAPLAPRPTRQGNPAG